jgi:NitT/TauT family transport system substrate-binding protein
MKRSLILAAAVLLALGTGPLPARAQTADTVKIGVMSSLTMTPFFLADALGYFKDEGLTVQLVPFDSAAQMVAPLAAGQLDVGGGAVSAGLYNAVGRGLDVRAVADLGSDPLGYGFQKLIIRSDLVKSGRYKTIKDLKGMTIAITAPGISTSALVDALVKKAGLTMNDVKLQYIGNPDQVAAMKNGSLDASFMPEPNATLAAKSGVANIAMADDSYYPDQQIAIMLYGATLLKARHDVGVKVMRAYLRAARYYNNNLVGGKVAGSGTETIMKAFATESKITDSSVLAAVTPNGINPNGKLNLVSMQKDLFFFRAAGLLETKTTVDDVIDSSFATEVVKQLGPYKPGH